MGAEAPCAARNNITHLSVVSSRQRSYGRRRCEKNYYSWMADNLTGHKKVLEIGCGTGYSTLALLEKGYDVIAIEKMKNAFEMLNSLYLKEEILIPRLSFCNGMLRKKHLEIIFLNNNSEMSL